MRRTLPTLITLSGILLPLAGYAQSAPVNTQLKTAGQSSSVGILAGSKNQRINQNDQRISSLEQEIGNLSAQANGFEELRRTLGNLQTSLDYLNQAYAQVYLHMNKQFACGKQGMAYDGVTCTLPETMHTAAAQAASTTQLMLFAPPQTPPPAVKDTLENWQQLKSKK